MASDIELHGTIAIGTEEEPASIGGRGWVVVSHVGARVGELRDGSIEGDLEEFDTRIDLGGVVDGATVGGPDGNIAAFAVEVGVEESFDHAAVAVSIREFTELGSIGVDDGGVAIVMFTGDEEEPFAIGRPLGGEIEGVGRVDMVFLGAIGFGDIDLVVFVVGDPLAIGGDAVTVGESLAVLGDIAFVMSVEVHEVGFGDTVDEWREAVALGMGESKEPGVVVADAIDGGEIGDGLGLEVEDAGVGEPTFGHAKGFVFTFPGSVFRGLREAEDKGMGAIGGPAGELCPGEGGIDERISDGLAFGAISADQACALGAPIGELAGWEIIASFGVSDPEVCAIRLARGGWSVGWILEGSESW